METEFNIGTPEWLESMHSILVVGMARLQDPPPQPGPIDAATFAAIGRLVEINRELDKGEAASPIIAANAERLRAVYHDRLIALDRLRTALVENADDDAVYATLRTLGGDEDRSGDIDVPSLAAAVTKLAAVADRMAQSATSAPAGVQRLRVSEVLQRLLDQREQQDGDRRAESEIAPIVRFAIKLLDDPIMADITGDQLLNLQSAMPDIPTPFGLPIELRADLYARWQYVKDNGWCFQRDGKLVRHKRTSLTTINTGWRLALTALWGFAINGRFAAGAVPKFYIKSKKNPPAAERDAFTNDELLKFFNSPPFTGNAGRSRLWTSGAYYYQGFLYWGELLCLLGGMRPGEAAQLRCHDILELHGEPHIRFARLAVEQEKEARFAPQQGGNDGKTDAAFRWIPIHPLLLRLGLLERRDAIVGRYITREFESAGGRDQLTVEEIAEIEWQAYAQWLFPDWPVYVKSTGEIKWSHHLSKAIRYGLARRVLTRAGLSQYSARHFFKGLIDDVKDLSERSRKIIMGHSTKGDVSTGYGPKRITEQQSEVVQRLSNRTIRRLAKILIKAKRRAERGELIVVDAWKIDLRTSDGKLQAALARRAEQYL